MSAFYNEIDPYAAEWLRNLIAAGHIAPGVVDERDIRDIRPVELAAYTQCHFFAGIGIWSRALRSAGWPDDRPVWTGSCPCQPFSAAGRRGGVADERHLWPHWHWLISQCRPAIVFGEQVASKDGRAWLDTVSADLEALGLAFGASDLCAAGFGGAHIRQRNYFVGLADRASERWNRRENTARQAGRDGPQDGGSSCRLANPDIPEQHGRQSPVGMQSLHPQRDGSDEGPAIRNPRKARSLDHDDVDWLLCRNPAGEPSWRPVEPRTFPLAHGVACRMDKLRAYGNGLDLETASEFVAAVMEVTPIQHPLNPAHIGHHWRT